MAAYLILLASFLMNVCLGTTYAWSVFVSPLREATGLGQGVVQLPFTVFYIAFPITTLFAGRLFEWFGPRRCAVAGGIFYGSGWFLAGCAENHFGLAVIGIGLMSGIGVGLAYLGPITTCVEWFPNRKGLVTGVAVAGFGGGAALISKLASGMMDTGATPFETMRTLGIGFLVVVPLSGLALRHPNGGPAVAAERTPLRPILGDRLFWILYLAMFAGLMGGLAVNANLKDLRPGAGAATGVVAVQIFAIANAAGRIGWGWLFDRMRAANAIRANLLAQATVLAAAFLFLRSDPGLKVFACLTGLNYGGVLVLYASSVARRWGPRHVGSIYGWIFSSNMPAALAPPLAGMAYDEWGHFLLPLAVIAGVQVVAAVFAGHRELKHAPGIKKA